MNRLPNSAVQTRPLLRRLVRAALFLIGLGIVRWLVLPAAIRDARIEAVWGRAPAYATLTWFYGPGTRPMSVIFDVAIDGHTGSATVDGEALKAEIPFRTPPVGVGRITASATYRLFGMALTRVWRFESAEITNRIPGA